MAFMDDLGCVFLVFRFTGKGEGVFGLAIGDLVNPAHDEVNNTVLTQCTPNSPEPLVCGPDQTRQMTFDIFNVVELGSEGVLDIHDDDFPIGLAFIEQRHDAENLDLLDLADVADLFADFANIEGVIVALGLGLGVRLRGILPSLSEQINKNARPCQLTTCLGEGTVIPNVSVVGETVADETQSSLLDILLNRIEGFLLANLHFSVRPARNFDDHVENAVVLVCEKRDVVEGRDHGAILFDVDAVFWMALDEVVK